MRFVAALAGLVLIAGMLGGYMFVIARDLGWPTTLRAFAVSFLLTALFVAGVIFATYGLTGDVK